jgi:hypothetical protein
MTREEGKSYLRRDPGRETSADAPNPLQLIGAAEWTEGVAVGDDARGEGRADSPQRLDLPGGGDIEVDDRGNDGPGRQSPHSTVGLADRAFTLLLSLPFSLPVVTHRVHGLDLCIECAPSGGVDRSLAVKHGDAPGSCAEHNY